MNETRLPYFVTGDSGLIGAYVTGTVRVNVPSTIRALRWRDLFFPNRENPPFCKGAEQA